MVRCYEANCQPGNVFLSGLKLGPTCYCVTRFFGMMRLSFGPTREEVAAQKTRSHSATSSAGTVPICEELFVIVPDK